MVENFSVEKIFYKVDNILKEVNIKKYDLSMKGS